MDCRDVQPYDVTQPSAVTSKAPPAAADSSLELAPTHSISGGSSRISAFREAKVGKRGRNRTGYYLALLYVLELQYRLERQVKGSTPARWQPLPRNRPDQFASWIIDDLELLGASPLECFAELLELLQREQLTCIADVLRYVVERKLLGANPDATERAQLRALPLQEFMTRLGTPAKATEKYPQARKFAQMIRSRLDRAWKEALILTASEYGQEKDWPRSAFLIGALPPSFTVINAHIFASLDDTDLVAEPTTLTVLQFYGLATGTLPEAPLPWREALEDLASLSDEELTLLNSLSNRQVRHIRTLSEAAVTLLREHPRHNPSNWPKLMDAISELSEAELEQLTGVRESGGRNERAILQISPRAFSPRVRFLMENWGASMKYLRKVKHLLDQGAWKRVSSLDEEVARMVTRKELTPQLIGRLQGWSEPRWQAVRGLLGEHAPWATACLQDWAVLTELFSARTHARLHLRDIFPASIAWLDDYLKQHFEDATLHDVGDLETFAHVVSRRVQQHLRVRAEAGAR